MPKEILYILVAVVGVEDSVAATAAIENLSNDEQDFEVMDEIIAEGEVVKQLGAPNIKWEQDI